MVPPACPGGCMSGRTAQKKFRANRSSIPGARKYVRSVCSEWKIRAELTDSAALLVSELATNVVLHAKGIGDFFELCIRRRRGVLIIEVTDSSAESIPAEFIDTSASECDAGFCLDQVSESGRGLLLVGHFADRWGIRQRADGPGKTVWAHLETRLANFHKEVTQCRAT
ncbi:ATP-binding protein [Streptomyces sp. NPDC020799]|uniref:ATP-binding protein n=1 Tax=Streptomyces sp. NPDC020799 TaxID=3365091 RepID=UPI0037A33DAA